MSARIRLSSWFEIKLYSPRGLGLRSRSTGSGPRDREEASFWSTHGRTDLGHYGTSTWGLDCYHFGDSRLPDPRWTRNRIQTLAGA